MPLAPLSNFFTAKEANHDFTEAIQALRHVATCVERSCQWCRVTVILDIENNGVRKNFATDLNINPTTNRLCSLGQQTCLWKWKRAAGEDIVANCFRSVSEV